MKGMLDCTQIGQMVSLYNTQQWYVIHSLELLLSADTRLLFSGGAVVTFRRSSLEQSVDSGSPSFPLSPKNAAQSWWRMAPLSSTMSFSLLEMAQAT